MKVDGFGCVRIFVDWLRFAKIILIWFDSFDSNQESAIARLHPMIQTDWADWFSTSDDSPTNRMIAWLYPIGCPDWFGSLC